MTTPLQIESTSGRELGQPSLSRTVPFFDRRNRPYLHAELVARNDFVEALARRSGDSYRAACDIGYSGDTAKKLGMQFSEEPYVQTLMEDYIKAKSAGIIKLRSQQHRVVELLFVEAEDRSEATTGTSRVAALVTLTKVLGMNGDERSRGRVSNRGGVMQVPASANLDDWQQSAASHQQDLINNA